MGVCVCVWIYVGGYMCVWGYVGEHMCVGVGYMWYVGYVYVCGCMWYVCLCVVYVYCMYMWEYMWCVYVGGACGGCMWYVCVLCVYVCEGICDVWGGYVPAGRPGHPCDWSASLSSQWVLDSNQLSR